MAKGKVVALGVMIDGLYERRAKRIELQREVDNMKAEERELQANIMERLHEMKSAKASGLTANATLKQSTVPKVESWPKFYAYVHKHKAFELLHQRIASTAWAEVVEAGKQVPGVVAVPVEDLSITKLTKS